MKRKSHSHTTWNIILQLVQHFSISKDNNYFYYYNKCFSSFSSPCRFVFFFMLFIRILFFLSAHYNNIVIITLYQLISLMNPSSFYLHKQVCGFFSRLLKLCWCTRLVVFYTQEGYEKKEILLNMNFLKCWDFLFSFAISRFFLLHLLGIEVYSRLEI